VRARHILVKTEKEAKEIAEELKKGGNFEEIAKAKSIGPSAPRGGDLGHFTKDKMVPEFSEVAFKLKKGQISAPVKTNFGWHIIKVEDRRMQQLQEFEAIKSRIRNVLLRQKVTEIADTLRKNAKIEYLDADAKPVEQKPQ
jgi:peptidyl-prolyl cis-trans isomerase C